MRLRDAKVTIEVRKPRSSAERRGEELDAADAKESVGVVA